MFSLPEKLDNMLWEYRLGITTRGLAGLDTADHEHIHYGTVPYRLINTILDRLQLSDNDIVVDLGCGKGRVLCCASLRPIKRSIGVEYSSQLAAIAGRNAQKLRSDHRPIEILNISAEDFDYSVGTVYYLFHPFGPKTLRVVLEKLRAGLDVSPRPVRIIYVNPVHNDVFTEYPWVYEYERWSSGSERSPEHTITWWRNNGDGV